MTLPETQSRETIEQILEASGWAVQDRQEVNLHAAHCFAVRELSLKSGHGEACQLFGEELEGNLADLKKELVA